MSEGHSYLVVDPLSVHFEFVPNQPLHAQISLHNPSKERIAFSIKPSQPSRYYTRSPTGYVDPGETLSVDIRMHALPKAPRDTGNCADKFTVQYVPVGKGETLIAPEVFNTDLHPVEKVEVSVVFD